MGITNTKSMLNIGLALLITGSLMGIYLTLTVSPLILIIGTIGVFGAFLIYEYAVPSMILWILR